MCHIEPDFKTKKAFKEAIKAGKNVYVYSPGMFPCKTDGIEYVEAPSNYHTWYSRVEIKDSRIIKVVD